MRRALTLRMVGTPTEEQKSDIGATLRAVLENGWWLPYYEDQYVMDAGGNDNVAFVVGPYVRDDGEISVQAWLTKWNTRPSEFKGIIKVDRFNDAGEEETAWLHHEGKLRLFIGRLGEILSDDAGMPIEKIDGKIMVQAAFIAEPGESLSRQDEKELERRAREWSERLSQVRGS